MPDQTPPDHRLSDGREDLGDSLARPVARKDRQLGEDFAGRNASDAPRLGNDFADPNYADRHTLASAFADPNSIDDTKLGNAFEQTQSSAKHHHRPVKQIVGEPFQKAKSNGVLAWFIVGVVVLFVLVLILGFLPRHKRKDQTEQTASENAQAPLVEVIKVARAKAGGSLTVPGTTTPLEEADIYARANGYLRARYVDIGDHVRKGQLLGLIDAPDLDQQVDQAREQLRQAEAQQAQQETQLALTKVTVDRYRALVERGVFSRQDGDQQEANYQAQRANLASAERNVEAFKANLRRVIALQSYERVTAPFDGVVTQRNVDVGALINAQGASGGNAPTPQQTPGQTGSSTTQNAASNNSGASGSGASLGTPATGGGTQGGPLFAIAKDDQLRILVSVPEGYAASVHPGTHATVFFQEYPNRSFFGDVTRNAGTIDQNTRTLLTEIVIKNLGNQLLPGMYAVVTFAAAEGGEGPLVIAGDAIGIRDDRPTVAVISDDKVHLTPVLIGRDYGPEVEIVSGLKEGDLIASSFSDEVKEGGKIRPQQDKQAAEKGGQMSQPIKPLPPGGSTQYGDPGIEDQDMQGQNAKPQQKKQGGGAKKASGKAGSQQ